MFHGPDFGKIKMFHGVIYNILGKFVSRETLSCVHNPNIGKCFT